jgi:hypothetical protein
MGIKHLNRFLRERCSKKSIHTTHLKQFANKTIVIDTSIYLYKFITDDSLMENMYLFISILKTNQITPIFIFDGKPPPEKHDLLRVRRMEKKEAEQKYLALQSSLVDASANNINIESDEKNEIIQEMEQLKRQFVRVRDDDIRKVKELMDAYGVCYYDAPAESDQLCAYFVNTGKAWACMSDDMDMFLYGCSHVIRHLSLMKQTVVLYDTQSILSELKMTERQFCEIMVLSGTDYNIHSNTSLYETIKWFHEYNKYCSNQTDNKIGFYVWLIKNTKYIKDFNKLLRTFQIFQKTEHIELANWESVVIPEKKVDMDKLKCIMNKEGFLFSM